MASLKTEYTIKKFASLVIIKYSEIDCTDPEFVRYNGEFVNEETSKAIFSSIELLLRNYSEIIDKISIEEFQNKDYLSSKRDFMNQLVSRCFKLSEDKLTFFEFLLVCVYICKFSKCIYSKYKCCKILKATADCLEFVYCKKYWDYFKEHGDFLGFANFCRRLNGCEPSFRLFRFESNEELLKIYPVVDFKRNVKVKILGCLNDISSSEIEVEIQMDMKCFVPPTGDVHRNALIRKYKQSEISQDDPVGDWEIVSEKTAKPHILCEHCGANCAQYPEFLVKVLKSCERVRVENK